MTGRAARAARGHGRAVVGGLPARSCGFGVTVNVQNQTGVASDATAQVLRGPDGQQMANLVLQAGPEGHCDWRDGWPCARTVWSLGKAGGEGVTVLRVFHVAGALKHLLPLASAD